MSRSDELFERAVKVIPGGVNSPVRAYGSVGMTPRFIEGASGPYVVDADSKKYIDYISSWGPMILGHNNQEVLNAVIRKAESGLSFGAATEIEEEMAARVNVLKDISASMARELGREATLAELAERMKMSEDEIRDIMKLTMDAMKVSGQAAEMAQKEIDEQE